VCLGVAESTSVVHNTFIESIEPELPLEQWREELRVAANTIKQEALHRLESRRARFLSYVAACECPGTTSALHLPNTQDVEVQDDLSALAKEVVSLRRDELQLEGMLAETSRRLVEQRKNQDFAATLRALKVALQQVQETSSKFTSAMNAPVGHLVAFMDRQAPVVCAKKLQMCW
jgi:hypothetical protein